MAIPLADLQASCESGADAWYNMPAKVSCDYCKARFYPDRLKHGDLVAVALALSAKAMQPKHLAAVFASGKGRHVHACCKQH
eukprot:scaffold211424_cov22-Tisochrysis_lutea.AAC.1